IQPAAFFKTPLQNFFVSPALFHPLDQIAMVHPEKIAANTVRRFHSAEIWLVIFVQLAIQMEPDLIDHPWEIHHALGHFPRASWKLSVAHARNTRAATV